ncbi:hypothetical protein [Salinimicrobium sp. WS361]|uniref:hypothetical protein n=1 Tax=Salinimicrobium sp. WS361 TaxID=3425123 RepID=UPI003D6DD701
MELKIFLRRLTIYACLFIGFFVLVFLLEKNLGYWDIGSDKRILVVGHSHPETAINDSLIDGLVNLASSGEAYNYNFYKMRYVLENNPQIEIVLVEFTNNNIEPGQDLWITGDEKMGYYLPQRIQFMSFKEVSFLYNENRETFKNSLLPIIRKRLTYLTRGFSYNGELGGYRHLNAKFPDSLLRQQRVRSSSTKVAELNISFLKSLIDFCEKRNIEVLLIRSPLHSSYSRNNEEILREILSSNFSNIEFLDFSNFPLKNEHFADMEHLNSGGANIFSNWLNDQIKSGLLESPQKEMYINQAIKSRSVGMQKNEDDI